MAAIKTHLFDDENPGETWYGTDIESDSLQSLPSAERYDASTDKFSIWLGSWTNLSPKKINYLLQQYTGVAGDIVLPLLTPTAEQGLFSSSFTVNSTQSNKLSGEFYDKLDELEQAKNSIEGTGKDSAVYRFWNKQASSISDINKSIKSIQADESLTDKEKKELLNAQYAMRNAAIESAQESLPEYEKAVEKWWNESEGKTFDEESDRIDYVYRNANREVFGSEYALETYNKDVYGTACELNEEGLTFDHFYDTYFDVKEATEGLTGYESSNAKRNAIAAQDMGDDEKFIYYNKYVSSSREDDYEAFTEAGMDFDDFIKANNAYAEIDNKDDLKAGEKATEFARWVNNQGYSAAEAAVIKGSFEFHAAAAVEANNYNKMIDNGVSETSAYEVAAKLYDLEPLEGETEVKAWQKYQAIAEAIEDPEEQLMAIESVQSSNSSDAMKYRIAYEDYSIEPEDYAYIQSVLMDFDIDGNGSLKNEEVENAIDSISTTATGLVLGGGSSYSIYLSNDQKAALWQLITGSKSSKNNPYSKSVGTMVISQKAAATVSSGGLKLTGGSSSSGGLKLTGGSSSSSGGLQLSGPTD